MSETLLKLHFTDFKVVDNFRAKVFRDIPEDSCWILTFCDSGNDNTIL